MKRPVGRPLGSKTREPPEWIIGEEEFDVSIPEPKERGHALLGSHRNHYDELVAEVAASKMPPKQLAYILHTAQPAYFAKSEGALVTRIRQVNRQIKSIM